MPSSSGDGVTKRKRSAGAFTEAKPLRKHYADPDFLAGRSADERLRLLIHKSGGNPAVLDSALETTARAVTEWTFSLEEQASAGKPFRKGGAGKKGKRYGVITSIAAIVNECGSSDFDDVLNVLSDTARCEDLFYSGLVRHRFQGVDESRRLIEYTDPRSDALHPGRRDAGDDFPCITFSTLRSYLSRIRANPGKFAR